MRFRFPRHTILPVFLMMSGNLYTQFSGNNLFEFLAGNIPRDVPAMLLSNYDQLNLAYRYKGFRASGRLEYNLNKFPERRYINPAQLQLQYGFGGFSFTAGNYYEMLGNGLLLRTYDIPGAVYESQSRRARHGFYKDLLGFAGEYSGEVLRFRVLYGKPLLNQLPPTVDWKDRRMHDMIAVNPGITIGQQNLDLNYMVMAGGMLPRHYASAQASGNLPFNFSYNVEMAAELGTGKPLLNSEGSVHAAYAGLNYSGFRFGASLEWKDYRNFVLPSGINDPPTLVKEHAYKVLNRSTHVPLLDNESGYQLELYYRFKDGTMITLNTSRAVNRLSSTYVFQEYFAELYSPLGGSASLKGFADYARAPFRGEPHRFAAGSILETPFPGRWSALAELEYQLIRRSGFLSGNVHNAVILTDFSFAARFSAGITFELSTDPFLTDLPSTLEIERGIRTWLGGNLKYKVNDRHTVSLFGGQRRGGPACTSGICYEVLDYTGIELRITSKF